MKPRTYLQARLLEHLAILKGMVDIETAPDKSTDRVGASLIHLLRCYLQTSTNVPDPLAPLSLSSPKRKTHRPPAGKKLDTPPPSA